MTVDVLCLVTMLIVSRTVRNDSGTETQLRYLRALLNSSYILSATSRAVAAPFSFRREYGIKGVHGAEGAGCVLLEFGSSR